MYSALNTISLKFNFSTLTAKKGLLISSQEKGRCRAWNETRCPHGLVQVDYTDPSRINSTLLKSNVKVIDPNSTIIYSCPVLLPGQDDATSMFVAPRGLGIKVGDVLSSAQARGVMHKVNDITNAGKIYACTLRESVFLNC